MKQFLKAHRILTVVIGVAIILGGYFGYRAFFGTKAATVQYVTAKAAKGTLVISVVGSGQVAALNQINIQPQISGTVSKIYVANNQSVKAGDPLIRLDTTNEERAVRDAQASLDNARLALATLLEPPTTSTLLQAQQSVVQANQNLMSSQNNLASDYSSAYTDISNTFIDLSGVMTGLNTVLYSTAINRTQADVDAYSNLIANYNSNVAQYNASAIAAYQVTLAAYNQSVSDFKAININSSTSTIESLLSETYGLLKSVSVANTNMKNLLDLVANTLQQLQQKGPAQLATDQTSMQSYISTINSHLSTLLQIQNSLQTDKQAIVSAGLSVGQTTASLEQLQSGPTALDIQTKQLAIVQAENSLADANQNLTYDSIRAPYDGIITSITAKVGQPVGSGSAIAILVSNAQLAQATLNEIDTVNVKVGEKATITFDALPTLTLTGKVSQVDTIGTVQQGVVTYNVQVTLDVPNPQVKPGMSDNLSVITNEKSDVLLVPNAAITTKQGVSTVQVMGTNGTPQVTEITIGLANSTMTEVVSGLNEGDAVVTRTATVSATTPTTSSGLGGIRIPGITGG